ncbi:MAG: hypothetical protein Q7S74_02190 [Nanoarchaeota archaeon]|nr:hypothetical protein [Nanoarchaeota archaeon]
MAGGVAIKKDVTDNGLFGQFKKKNSRSKKWNLRIVNIPNINSSHVIVPQYLPQIKAHCSDDAGKRRFRSGENTSEFYTRVYQSLEGGSVSPLRGTNVDRLTNGKVRCNKPDISYRKNRGRGYTEVKASSTRSAEFKCSLLQLRNYSFKLLDRIHAGDELPWVDYAFFRYGDRNVGDLQKLENGLLTATLASHTRDLLIAPLNLLYFIFINSPLIVLNQTSSNSTINYRDYWNVKSGFLNNFHRTFFSSIEDLLKSKEAHFGALDKKDLGLDKLESRQYESPIRYIKGNKEIKPFIITKYRMPPKDYKKWLKHFSRNYERILEGIGITDDYFRVLDVPF